MPCYRQIKRKWEKGTGWVTAEMVISDSYANLFTQTGVEDVDIFKFNSSKEDLEKNGAQKEDEFNFEMSDAKIKTTSDQDARDFVVTAETDNIWLALFVYETDPYTSGTVADKEFSGKIRSKISGQNIVSFGAQWGSNPNPLRDWKVSAQSLGAAVMESINMADKTVDSETVKGVLTEMAEDTTWVSDNVEDVESSKPGSLTYKTKNMIDMNIALEKLRGLVETRVKTDIPEFQLSFKASQSGFTFVPTEGKGDGSPKGGHHWAKWESRPDKAGRLNLLDLTATEYLPYVSVNLFITGYGISDPDDKKELRAMEKDYSFERYDNFKDFLYAIAPCFGCFCIIRNLSATHLEVEFVPKGDIDADEVFVCDYTGGDLDLQTEKVTEKMYKGRANYVAVEGRDYYKVENGYSIPSEKFTQGSDEKGDLLALTVSPTLKGPSDWYESNSNRPHNFHNTYNPSSDPYFIHTAIYIKYPLDEDYTFVTPAMQVVTVIDGDKYVYDNLAGCLNALSARNGLIHRAEYKRTIPWISRFSISPTGSNQSWKNCKVASIYTEDSREYLIAGIERDWDKYETLLRLTRSSKYNFANPIGTEAGIVYAGPERHPGAGSGIAGEALESGDAGMWGTDSKIYKMTAEHNNYGSYAGIIDNSVSEGGRVYLRNNEPVMNDEWEFTPGKLVYVRTSDNCNLSHESFLQKTDTEDLLICVGYAISQNCLLAKKMFESIAYPPLEDL